MGLLKTIFDAGTIRWRPEYQKHITENILFDMPHIGIDPAIILGATRATAFMVQAAVEAGHQRFVVVGGVKLNAESALFSKLLESSIEKAGLPKASSDQIRECDYAKEMLVQTYKIPESRITIYKKDTSSNIQQNLELLAYEGFHRQDKFELYALAGTAHRVLGTARKVFGNHKPVMSVHNIYPHGVDKTNWMNSFPTAFYALSEAAKILGPDAPYVRRGYCVPVDIGEETARAFRCNGLRAPTP